MNAPSVVIVLFGIVRIKHLIAVPLFSTVDPQTGKKIRGQKCEVKDYDQFVFDIYAKYVPQPVDIKTQQSVYDLYDILEEIGTGAFGVVHRCREIKTGD